MRGRGGGDGATVQTLNKITITIYIDVSRYLHLHRMLGLTSYTNAKELLKVFEKASQGTFAPTLNLNDSLSRKIGW